jgi:hypothetical protein
MNTRRHSDTPQSFQRTHSTCASLDPRYYANRLELAEDVWVELTKVPPQLEITICDFKKSTRSMLIIINGPKRAVDEWKGDKLRGGSSLDS